MLHVGNALHQSSLLCSHPARLCLGWLVPGEDEGRSAAVLEFGGHRRVTLCVADVFKRHEELDGADSGLPQSPGDGSSGGAGGRPDVRSRCASARQWPRPSGQPWAGAPCWAKASIHFVLK